MLESNFISGYETVTVQGLTQWDKGQKLKITGLATLPATYQVHFANTTTVEAIVMMGSATGGVGTVDIPNSLLEDGLDIRAWIYVTDAEDSETIRTILMPVTERTKPADFITEPNPTEQTMLENALNTVNTALGEIDNINAQTIGGSNLLTGSKDFSGTWVNSDKWTTETDKYKGFVVKKSAIAYGGLSQAFSVPNNTKLVYSFYAKTDNPSAIHAVYAADDAYANEFDKTYEIVKLTTEWARYEVTFTSKVDNAHANIRLHLATGTAITYICAPCLQYGDKATEWLPNDLDYIGDLSSTGVAGDTASDQIKQINTDFTDKINYKHLTLISSASGKSFDYPTGEWKELLIYCHVNNGTSVTLKVKIINPIVVSEVQYIGDTFYASNNSYDSFIVAFTTKGVTIYQIYQNGEFGNGSVNIFYR